MPISHYTYLFINLGVLAVPLVLSFDKKVAFYKNWKYLFPSILFTAFIFIIWDMLKTVSGVWDFNPKYIIGTYIVNLPIEEWLFFITIPYACVFIYESLNVYFKDFIGKIGGFISAGVIALLITLSYLYYDRIYTVITFPFAAIFLLIHHFLFKNSLIGRFWFTYIIHLIPFLLVNGLLTSLPVVTYNDAENMGIRIGSIPVEDTVYSMLLLLMNITFYERLKGK